MDFTELEFDQGKVLAWWTGRIANADFARWTGQSERDIRLIFDTPFMRNEISGGGRGSKTTRRVSRKARNAVALVVALRRAGMSIEAAADLINSIPVIADFPTETIDFSPSMLEAAPAPIGRIAILSVVQPDGGWQTTDIVPDHIFNRRCRPVIRQEDIGAPITCGNIAWLPEYTEATINGLPPGYRPLGEQMYRPEIDPLGMIDYGNDQPDAHDALDHHFYIVDAKWVWVRYSYPDPRQFVLDTFQATELYLPRRLDPKKVTFDFEPIAEIDIAKRSSAPIRGDDAKEKLARRAWGQPKTKLDVNATVAIRDMKRVALGLISPP